MLIKKILITGLIGTTSLTGVGCATNTQTGALVGAGAGAALGAAVFHRVPVAGAVLGGAVGAATGAAIGNSVDREQAYRKGYYYDYPPPPARYEVLPPAPYAGAVWHPGYGVLDHGTWLWVHGYWT
jgi:hypothetical protein